MLASIVNGQQSRLNNHWYLYQQSQPGLDVKWTSNSPKSTQTTGGIHPSLNGYHSTNVLYENNGFGSSPSCYAISGDDGYVHVYAGDGREAKVSNVKTAQGHTVTYIEARKDEIGLLPIPGYPEQFIVLARSNQIPSSQESGVFLLDLNGNNFDPNGIGIDYPNYPSLTNIGGTAPLLGKSYSSNECTLDYSVDGDAIAASIYDETENRYIVYSCGLHTNLNQKFVAIYKTVIDFDQFDPSTKTPPSVTFSSSPITVSVGAVTLQADAPYLTEMELSPNQKMLAVATASAIWFMQLNAFGDVVANSQQYVSSSKSVGLEFSADNDKLFISKHNSSYPSSKSKLSYIDISNNGLLLNVPGNAIKEVPGSEEFSNTQIEIGADGRIYGMKGNQTGNAATGLVAYNENTDVVDNDALAAFYNNHEVPVPEDYMAGSGACGYKWSFFTLQDQIDARSPVLLLSNRMVADIYSAISLPKEGWQFLVEDENGNEILDYPETNDEGIVVVPVEKGLDYRVTQIFKEEWVPKLDYNEPNASTGFLEFQIDQDEVYWADFTNHNVIGKCNNIPGMVAYFHFQEENGDQTVNMLGENAHFFTSSQLTGNVIGTPGSQVPQITGVYMPTSSYHSKTLDIAANAVTMVANSYFDIDFSTESFTVETYVKANTPSSSTDMTIVRKMAFDPVTLRFVGWEFGINNNEPYFELRGDNGGSGIIRATSVGNFIPNTTDFHHVAFVLNRDENGLKIYINGTLHSAFLFSSQFLTASLSNLGDLELGEDLNGNLDEFAIFNRALSSNEVIDAMEKCRDYLEVGDFILSNTNGQDYHIGEFTIHNGHLTSRDMAYSISPILSNIYGCDVNGPAVIWGNHGKVEVQPGTSETRTFQIPTDLNANSSDQGCMEIWVFDQQNREGFSEKITGTMMNQMQAPPNDPTSLETQIEAPPFSLYPNPAINSLSITSKQRIHRVQVYSVNGQKIHEVNGLGKMETTLNISNLSEGIYTLKVLTNSGQHIEQFIKH